MSWTDAFTAFGVYLTRGSYASLLVWPSIKEVDKTSWQEEDYADVDLERLYLASKQVTLFFAIKNGSFEAFWAYLAQSPLLYLNVAELGLKFKLRITSIGDYTLADKLTTLSMNVVDDTPLYGYTYAPPAVTLPIITTRAFSFSGNKSKPFADYGVSVLMGTTALLSAVGNIKPLLVVNTAKGDGSTYDANPLDTITTDEEGNIYWTASSNKHGKVTKDTHQYTLSCLLVAPTITEAIRNYYALLHDLIEPNEAEQDITRKCALKIYDKKGMVSAYYSNQSVNALFTSGNKVWIQFSITFNLLSPMEATLYVDFDLMDLLVEENGVGGKTYSVSDDGYLYIETN